MRKILSALFISTMLVSQLAFATPSERVQQAEEAYDVNDVLSSEYLLSSTGSLNSARLSLVAVDTVDTTDTTSAVAGMIYYKGNVPYPDGGFEGTITNEGLVLAGDYVNAYGNSTGDLDMTFKVTTSTSGAYIVSGTGNLAVTTVDSYGVSTTTTESFTFSESIRGKYTQNEVEELQAEIESYISGEEEFVAGNPIPATINEALSTEYLANDGYRLILFAADDAKLAEYGIDSTYNIDTVGVIFSKTSTTPIIDWLVLGNMSDNGVDTATFEGYWLRSSSDYGFMTLNLKVKTIYTDDTQTTGYYIVGGNGTWPYEFKLLETGRAKYSKHELQEVEDNFYEYLADNKEELSDELDTAEEEDPIAEDDVENAEEEDTEATEEESGECNPFTDVNSDYEYCESVQYVKDQGIVSGYPDGTYKPTNTLNRAEFAKIVIGATHTEEEMTQCLKDNLGESFKDTPRSQWFAKYVCVAKEEGIIGGYSDGTFQPTRQIALSEAAKIMSLAFDLEVGEMTEPWYKIYIDALSAENAIPLSFNAFDQAVERGEMAEMIARLHSSDTSKDSESYESLGGVVTETEDEEVAEESDNNESEENSSTSSVTTFEASLKYASSNVTTEAMGYGSFTLEGRNLSYQIDIDDMYNTLTSAHFHNYSNDGAVEAAITFIGDAESGKWESTGVWENLTDAQIEYLMEGSIYVNAHTDVYPDGEIMGHVLYVK